MSQIRGGQLVAQALKRHGVTAVFSFCGRNVESIYDGCLDENIRVVDTRHEQTAGFAADASARLSGIPGVAIVSAGPGITNSVTPLANARRAFVPLILVACTPATNFSDRGASQQLDGIALISKVTKWAAVVPSAARIEEYVRRAFRIALGGCPGPVYLEIPANVLQQSADGSNPCEAVLATHRPAASQAGLLEVSNLLKNAQRPVFIVGSQLRWSAKRPNIAKIAGQLGVPFYLNGLARGSLPFGHPSLLVRSRRRAMAEADVIVLVGTPIDFRLDYGEGKTWKDSAKLVHVNLDSEILGQNRQPDIALIADPGLFLQQLADLSTGPAPRQWLEHLRTTENSFPPPTSSSDPNICPQLVYRQLASRLEPNDILIADGGSFVSHAAHGLTLQDNQIWLDSGPFGALGIGPGFALAASLYRPESRIILLTGDGTFGLSAGEFEALSRHGTRVVCIVGHNEGRERYHKAQAQFFGPNRRVGTQLSAARYDQVVVALGGQGACVETRTALGPALDTAFANSGPTCLNIKLTS